MSEKIKTVMNLIVDEEMVSEAMEMAKAEIKAEMNRGCYMIDNNTLLIHAPVYAHEIKRIVFNGTEIPLEGVTNLNFSADPLSSYSCELTVTRIPIPGAK